MTARLYLWALDRPHERFDCRECGGTHLRGAWARTEHRLLAICEVNPIPLPDFVTVTAEEVAAVAAAPSTDNGCGLVVECNHAAGEDGCSWPELQALVPGAVRRWSVWRTERA